MEDKYNRNIAIEIEKAIDLRAADPNGNFRQIIQHNSNVKYQLSVVLISMQASRIRTLYLTGRIDLAINKLQERQ